MAHKHARMHARTHTHTHTHSRKQVCRQICSRQVIKSNPLPSRSTLTAQCTSNKKHTQNFFSPLLLLIQITGVIFLCERGESESVVVRVKLSVCVEGSDREREIWFLAKSEGEEVGFLRRGWKKVQIVFVVLQIVLV